MPSSLGKVKMPLFVSCPRGVEPLLVEELAELGIIEVSPGFCGVYVRDDSMASIYRINYCSRLACRVLLPLQQFRCFDDKGLYHGASNVDWNRLFKRNYTLAIDANVQHPKIRNSLFAAQVVKDAICDQLRAQAGWRPSVDLKSPDIQLNLFIHEGKATLSFDCSGLPLFKRGYRQDAGPAPLQEALAAALLRLAAFRGDEILIDPCCGSGTLLIEAALIATRTAPGFLRKEWGFTKLPEFSMLDWLKVKNEADSTRRELPKGQIQGCEIDPVVARSCRDNLKAAGFQQQIEVWRKDFVEHHPDPAPSLLITNPPHGKRLSETEELRDLYRQLGSFMKENLSRPGRGFVFTGNLELMKEVGLASKRRHVISNGGEEARLLEYDLY
jgi:putative N6-adenine-specific DNA methylase